MLPPLNQIASSALGPSQDAVQRPTAPPVSVSSPFRWVNAARRVSAAKPPSAMSPALFSSPRRATSYRPAVSPLATACEPQPLMPGVMTTIETMSRIPREFFVVETSAVLPQTQYPPSQYQSTFVGAGAWETVVFPALVPHTRQQVLCLRHALETMRGRVEAEARGGATATATVPTLALEYTEKEWALHSVCFHELARQIKFICREQSELLFEIQSAYDASITRLASLVRQLQQQHEADQKLAARLREDQRVAEQETEQRRQQAKDDSDNNANTRGNVCQCGRSDRRGAIERWRRRPKKTYGRDDRYEDEEEDSHNDEDDEDEDDAAWRAFQRRRRLRMRQFGNDDDSDSDESDFGDGAGGLVRRASEVEENTAAMRVQQAFLKYQQRKDAHRTLQRQEKRDAALDIQRSYRGYRERKRALHHRAVVAMILKRRKQVAAVQLLQMNVRAYLIKMRREGKHGRSFPSETARASAVEAQRSVAEDVAMTTNPVPITIPEEDTDDTVQDEAELVSSKDHADQTLAPEGETDRFAQLLNSMSDLAAAFSFLHSRRRNAKRIKSTVETASTKMEAEPVAVPLEVTEKRVSDPLDCSQATTMPLPSESQATEADDSAAERELLNATIRRAEHLMHSFRSVIHDVRRDDPSVSSGLTKATSTTSLLTSESEASGTNLPPKDTATVLFLDDDGEAWTGFSSRNKLSPSPSPRQDAKGDATNDGESLLIDDEEDDSDATHLDDVLWQASVYTPHSSKERHDEASARQLLLRELLASRDQQKSHAALKQFIVDIYDTIVGRLSELPRERLQKLVQVHASLALSLADGQRLLRRRRGSTTPTTTCASDYEPMRAFVGELDVKTLIHDHFQCQVGLRHLVDASVQRVETDLRRFLPVDPDVQRFYEYLTRKRSLADLVFFCLCRFFARDASRSSSSSRQPVFHSATLRELVDVNSAMAIAARLFHACGDDASMAETDAFVIEPNNEIYTRHLPSRGLQQVQVILRDYVAPVDDDVDGAFPHLHQDQHLRATNANQFHAREYNASAPRSPLRQRPPPATYSFSTSSSSPSSWMFFTELVDLLRRYRSATRHFHAFVHWTYELFHDAFRQQRQQQLADVIAVGASSGTPLLEEAAFVETLLPYSLGASDRELRNVFQNTLRQRQLQRLMPVRVFVSVVLVLLRNGMLSVTSYQPLQRPGAGTSQLKSLATDLGSHRRDREERQWLQLALEWRAQEQRFEATVVRLQTKPSGVRDDQSIAASRLLQWRSELYELFMHRSGSEGLERAQALCELLLQGLARSEGDGEEEKEEVASETRCPETGEEEEFISQREDDCAAAAVGSPWATRQRRPSDFSIQVMLGDDNQRETASPSYQRGHRLPAESLQQNGTEDEYVADRGHAIAATCEATAQRLRLQTEQLKRFHQQICLRVNERVLQQREQQQSRDKQIDAKLARLLQLPPAADGDGGPLRAAMTTATAPPALQLSRGPHLEALLNAKRDQLRGYDKALSVVEKVLRSDAQAREMLLASTRVPRVRECRSCEDVALDKIYEDEGNQAGDGNGEHLARDGDVALPAKQRVELYAAVRRRYMAIERERVHQRRKGAGELPSERNLVTKLPLKGKKPVNTNRLTESERRSGGHVTIVEASTGCETKVQRQVARTSSTPWRNSPSQQPPPSSTKSQAQATTQERFLTALQAELGTPALCSCGGRKGNVECANNCEFYRQPKRKERAAASVCKQHET